MKSTLCSRLGRLAFLLSAISASSCATDRQRIAAAEEAKAVDAVILEAIELGKRSAPLPAQPAECRGPIRSGAADTDRADVALVRLDGALGRANATLAACAAFYDRIQKKGPR